MRILIDECIDCNLPFQQNLPQFDIAIVVVSAPSNRLADLEPLVPRIPEILPTALKGAATIVSAN